MPAHAQWRAEQELISFGSAHSVPLSVSVVEQESTRRLQVQITTTSHQEPLSLAIPLTILKTDQRRDFLLRYLGFRVDLFAGDAMPFYHDGTFHLFYLIDRRHHRSKWRLGAHQWAHLAVTDLIHWTSYPVALPIFEQWEGSICTGSVFYDKGTYYAFYAKRMPDRTERLALALSKDGITFRKCGPPLFNKPQAPFR